VQDRERTVRVQPLADAGGGRVAECRFRGALRTLGVLVIDMIQFFIKMAAVIAAAYFA